LLVWIDGRRIVNVATKDKATNKDKSMTIASSSGLSSSITVIPQIPELLSGSLRENLDPVSQYRDDDATLNGALRTSGLFSLQSDDDNEDGCLMLKELPFAALSATVVLPYEFIQSLHLYPLSRPPQMYIVLLTPLRTCT